MTKAIQAYATFVTPHTILGDHKFNDTYSLFASLYWLVARPSIPLTPQPLPRHQRQTGT